MSSFCFCYCYWDDKQHSQAQSDGCKILIDHTAYNWNNKSQKCAGMGLNGFIFKKINKNYAESMKKIMGAV